MHTWTQNNKYTSFFSSVKERLQVTEPVKIGYAGRRVKKRPYSHDMSLRNTVVSMEMRTVSVDADSVQARGFHFLEDVEP